MARACGRAVTQVFAVTLVLLSLAGSVRAQLTSNTAMSTFSNPFCGEYLWAVTWIHPPQECCTALRTTTNSYGAACYCKQLNMYNPMAMDNMTKAYTLPQDCEVAEDMTNCPLPTPPPAAPPRAPPPPAGRSTPTPPGVLPPPTSNPTAATASPPASSASSSSSMALPIAGGIFGGGVGLSVIIWLIVTRCKFHWHLKGDLNSPCCCCGRRPRKQYSQRLDQYAGDDKMPGVVPTNIQIVLPNNHPQ